MFSTAHPSVTEA